jgi:excisionase family DNA binding protein
MSALEASNDNIEPEFDESKDDSTPLVIAPNDRSRATPIIRAVATGFCVGARMLMAELGDERTRALLAVPPAAPQNDLTGPTVPAEVMSADETAVFLGVDRNTVYDAAGRGEIPHQRIGKRLLFSRAQIVSWLGACKAAPVRNG